MLFYFLIWSTWTQQIMFKHLLIKKHNRLLYIIHWDIKYESIGINKCKMLHNHLFSVQVEADIRNMWYTYMYLPERQRFSLALLASFVNWTKCWKYDKFEQSIHTCLGFTIFPRYDLFKNISVNPTVFVINLLFKFWAYF